MRATNAVSWFQEHADLSLRLIHATRVTADSSIIDVGGGASTLGDELVKVGFRNITVLDLSCAARATARDRLGPRASMIQWLEADIAKAPLPKRAYGVWHDRAVFHFLTAV